MKKEVLWNNTCKLACKCRIKEEQLNQNASLEYYNDVAILYCNRKITAIYYNRTNTLFVFDYLSRQAYATINTAAIKLKVSRITYLYRRSDSIIEKGLKPHINSYKLTPKEFNQVVKYDFTSYIPNSIFDSEVLI